MNKGNVAAVLLINKEKKILLYLRDDKKTIPYPNTWAMLGGHLEESEKQLDALKRELKEEIGIEVENPVFIGEFDDKAGNDVYIYKSKIKYGVEELKLTEGQKLKYFDFEEIMKIKNIPKPLQDFLRDNRKKILN